MFMFWGSDVSLELISDSGCEQAKSFQERLSHAIFYDMQGRTCNGSCFAELYGFVDRCH